MNMGSVVKQPSVQVHDMESASFTALFWSADPEPYGVQVTAGGYPDGWTVVATPQEFLVGGGEGSEGVVVPGHSGPVMAVPVRIVVEPRGSPAGTYYVSLDARSSTGPGAIEFSQARKILLRVDVVGPAPPKNGTVDVTAGSLEVSSGASTPADGARAGGDQLDLTLLYVLSFIGVFVVSVVIYRYA